MTLFYKSRKSNIESRDGKKKWHPCIIKMGATVETLEMANEIAEKSSLTPGDVQNVVTNLMNVMRKHLMNSKSVRLDGLGTFTVIARSKGKGVDTEKEVNASQIADLRIRFTPSYTRNSIKGTTRAMFSEIEFAKWEGKANEDNEDSEDDKEPGGGIGIDPDA